MDKKTGNLSAWEPVKKYSSLLSVASHPWCLQLFSRKWGQGFWAQRRTSVSMCSKRAPGHTPDHPVWKMTKACTFQGMHAALWLVSSSAQNASWHRILLDKVGTCQGLRALLAAMTCQHVWHWCLWILLAWWPSDLSWNGPQAWQWAVMWRLPLALYSECMSARLLLISSCCPGLHPD